MMEKRGGEGSELVMIYVARIIFTFMAVVVDLLPAILNKEHRFQEPLLFKCSTPACYDSYITSFRLIVSSSIKEDGMKVKTALSDG